MMMLESNDKKQLQIQEGFLSDLSPRSESMTLGGHCEFIEHNSTYNKWYDIKCHIYGMHIRHKRSDLIDGSDPDSSQSTPSLTTIEVLKRYETESPDRVYSLQLSESNDFFQLNGQEIPNNPIDSSKSIPIIDTAVKTLKLE